jgi:hypothetical protein
MLKLRKPLPPNLTFPLRISPHAGYRCWNWGSLYPQISHSHFVSRHMQAIDAETEEACSPKPHIPTSHLATCRLQMLKLRKSVPPNLTSPLRIQPHTGYRCWNWGSLYPQISHSHFVSRHMQATVAETEEASTPKSHIPTSYPATYRQQMLKLRKPVSPNLTFPLRTSPHAGYRCWNWGSLYPQISHSHFVSRHIQATDAETEEVCTQAIFDY